MGVDRVTNKAAPSSDVGEDTNRLAPSTDIGQDKNKSVSSTDFSQEQNRLDPSKENGLNTSRSATSKDEGQDTSKSALPRDFCSDTNRSAPSTAVGQDTSRSPPNISAPSSARPSRTSTQGPSANSCSYVHASWYDSDPFFFSNPADRYSDVNNVEGVTGIETPQPRTRTPSMTTTKVSRRPMLSPQASVWSDVDLISRDDLVNSDLSVTYGRPTCNGYLLPAVDGPISWVVMVIAMVTIMVVDGFVFTTGLRLADWQEHFQCEDMKKPALVSSVMFGAYFMTGGQVAIWFSYS